MDVVSYNRDAWNRQARRGSRWCTPVGAEEIEAARRGEWRVILTPNKSVPKDWFCDIKGRRLLCLASGGGQQAPVLAAAGAAVTSFDNSDEQLGLDKLVADREGLEIRLVQGDMADLSVFPDESFDLIFHPVSNVFAADVKPVWRECDWDDEASPVNRFCPTYIATLARKRQASDTYNDRRQKGSLES